MTLHVDNDAANLLNTESILLLLSVPSICVHSVHHWGPHLIGGLGGLV